MLKEKRPQYFILKDFVSVISLIIVIISLISYFNFFNKLDDFDKVTNVFVPISFVILVLYFVINTIRYCWHVRKFYDKYENLYNNNQALVDNFNKNNFDLQQEQNKNIILHRFISSTMQLLLTINDSTKEERSKIRKAILEDFLNLLKGDENNE